MNVSFPVILLFWALSLSPVWLNIEGWQDFSYKNQIIFFYSENNSNSLNRRLNTNLIDVQWHPQVCNTVLMFTRFWSTQPTNFGNAILMTSHPENFNHTDKFHFLVMGKKRSIPKWNNNIILDFSNQMV